MKRIDGTSKLQWPVELISVIPQRWILQMTKRCLCSSSPGVLLYKITRSIFLTCNCIAFL